MGQGVSGTQAIFQRVASTLLALALQSLLNLFIAIPAVQFSPFSVKWRRQCPFLLRKGLEVQDKDNSSVNGRYYKGACGEQAHYLNRLY